MKQFVVYVQQKLHKTVEAKNLIAVFRVVVDDIKNGAVSHYDANLPANIKIVPVA